jgi:histone H3/H4
MIKNKKKDNTLIKSSSLKKAIYQTGIKRVNKKALECLEAMLSERIEEKLDILAHKLAAKGKKTLEKGDIEEISKKEGKESYWEI